MDYFYIKKELKKALHTAMAKAYRSGNKTVQKAIDTGESEALRDIVRDLRDPDSSSSADMDELPVEKESVLNKENKAIMAVHDIKQAQAKAKLGLPQKSLSKFIKNRLEKSGFRLLGRASKRDSHKKGHIKEKAPKILLNTRSRQIVVKPLDKNLDSAKYGLKKASLRLKHENEKAKLASQRPMKKAKIDQGLSASKKRQNRYARAGEQVGVHNAPFKSVPSMSVSGAEIAQTGRVTDVAINSHKSNLKDLKRMPKPNLGKARIDDNLSIREKVKARGNRNERVEYPNPKSDVLPKTVGYRQSERGVHTPMKEIDGSNNTGSKTGEFARAARNASDNIKKDIRQTKFYNDVAAKELHGQVRREQKAMPKPDLGKSEMRKSEKAPLRKLPKNKYLRARRGRSGTPKL